jgi:hypothetical protein
MVCGAVAVVAGVGGALLIPGVSGVLDASSSANVAGACVTPSAATSVTAAAAPATAASTVAPTPSATAPAAAAAAAVTPLAAVNQLENDVQTGQSNGQIRSDVALDLENLIEPVLSDIQAGQVQPSQISQLVTTLQGKIATRSTEAGAITASAAAQLNNDLTQLGQSVSTATTTSSASASASASATPCPSATPTATPTAAAANVNCNIIVPADPLSAQGLATPYQLTGPNGMTPVQSGCNMANAANLGAFVQATILNLQTGQLSVYDPLVITQGTTPAVTPTVPTLPARSVVTVDFGFNGTDLTQVGATANALQQGNCVNGQAGSVFGQVSFCNGAHFFTEAFLLEREGKLVVPSEGTSGKIVASGGNLGTGQDCPVTRNFDMIDQDPSDNVTTEYLLNPATGQTAQDTTANAGNMAGATPLLNGSDNTLLDTFMDPVLGCTPFQAPDLANNNMPTSSQALDELLAAKNQPVIPALVPENDEMVLNGQGNVDVGKTDMYRKEIGETKVNAQNSQFDSPAMYCQNMVNIQTPFLAANQTLLAGGTSPVVAVGNNLFTFLANRLNMSFTNLGCQAFGLTNPVMVTLDGNGVAIAATLNTTMQTATSTTGTASAAASAAPAAAPNQGPRKGRPNHQLMDPSGM